MRVLVLDGNQNQAVACVRSLACAGHRVVVGESCGWSKAGWSRFSFGSVRYPPPHQHASDFVRRIAEIAADAPGTFVLPCTEATTLPLSAQRDVIFAAGARMVLPAHADLVRAADKEETTRLAQSLGIKVPETMAVCDLTQAEHAARSVSYPAVLKPRSSEELAEHGLRTAGRPHYARDAGELVAAYRQISRLSPAVLVQEFVQGDGMGYFALLCHGELRAEFAHRRIRDVYPSGSGSALRVSVPAAPEIRQAGLAMLRALNWHGAAMVEFRQPPGQPPVFMEVNGRLWHSLPLACQAGADFPAWLAQMAEHGDIAPPAPYRPGVRCRWLLGDLRHLLGVLRGAPKGYPMRYPSRLRTLLSEITPVPGTYHDNFRWADPLPELGDWLSVLTRAATKKS
jgi:predicted ATP-grasp superfamily ATP-dependent carboligase